MPLHDWTRVHAGEYHDFHGGWLYALKGLLNRQRLPRGYYAAIDQRAARLGPDLLTLDRRGPDGDPDGVGDPPSVAEDVRGGVALAQAPPRATRRGEGDLVPLYLPVRRSLSIRHVSGHVPVAMLELASPANKDRRTSVEDFVGKCLTAMTQGLHVAVVDPFPPSRHDPAGLAATVAGAAGVPVDLRGDVPGGSAASCRVRDEEEVEVYGDPLPFGLDTPPLPLFYDPDHYVDLPLQAAYDLAFADAPEHVQDAVAAA